MVPIFTRAVGWLFFMNWINIKTSDLRSPEFIGSDPTARGTWVAVLGYCYEQENGGRIKGCKAWKDRQWQQVCGVTREEIDGAKSLMSWQDDDLQVWGYPAELEDEIKRKREAGRKGGQARTQAKIEASKANGAKHNPSRTQAEPKQEPNVIVIERERVIEKKTEMPVPGSDFQLQGGLPGLPPEKPAKSKPSRNLLMDALAGCGGADPLQVVASAWSGIGKALEEIRGVCPDVSPDEITRRAKNYRTHMRESVLTPNALAKNWALCDKPNQFLNSGQKPGGTSTYELEARAHGYTL